MREHLRNRLAVAQAAKAPARPHPEHRELFDELEFTDAATAVVAVATWLARVDALGDGASDRVVLATLNRRGVGFEARGRLAGELRIAQNAPFAAPPPDDGKDITALTLHGWFTDWATTARSIVKRKDWLILLGLAERRRK